MSTVLCYKVTLISLIALSRTVAVVDARMSCQPLSSPVVVVAEGSQDWETSAGGREGIRVGSVGKISLSYHAYYWRGGGGSIDCDLVVGRGGQCH